MAHYLLNFMEREPRKGPALRDRAVRVLRAGMWGVDVDEPLRDALGAGDLVLAYVGAPERSLIGRAELASAAHAWTPSEAQAYPGAACGGVLLTQVVEWKPAVEMSAVLSKIASPYARADFETGIVRITAVEYEAALAVADGRTATSG